MTQDFHRSRTRVAWCGLIAVTLLTAAGWARADTKKSANPAVAAGSAAATPLRSVSIEEALQLTKKSPKDPNAYLALGGAYRRAGRFDDAVEAFKKMVLLEPKSSTAHVSL
ncbi:MAG: tetratricopeptide repeat protein, partial [Candidatus Eisenbacteria bacterium]